MLCLRPFERSARGEKKSEECPESQSRTLIHSKIKLHEGLHANNAVGFDATHAGKIEQAKSNYTKGLLANMLLVKSNACKHVKLKHGKFQGKKLF